MAQQKRKTSKAGGKARRTTGRRTARRSARRQPDRLRDTWNSTVRALTEAEAEVEKQIRRVLKRNKITTKDASTALRDIGRLIDRERKQAVRDFESRLKKLQGQVRKERRALDRMVEDAVHSALASFNIPSRKEVTELTRKVNQLSRQIDSLPRSRPRRPASRKKSTPAAAETPAA